MNVCCFEEIFISLSLSRLGGLDLEKFDIHCVASVVKQLVREMPEPLIANA